MDALHHRWEELEADRPMEKIVRRRLIGEKAMLSHVTLEAGCEVAAHSHENEQWVILLEGGLRFGLGDPEGPDFRTLVVAAGEVLHLPSGLPHSATALENNDQTVVVTPQTTLAEGETFNLFVSNNVRDRLNNQLDQYPDQPGPQSYHGIFSTGTIPAGSR